MRSDDLHIWMKKHGMNDVDLAEFLGVTRMAVRHWLNNARSISLATSRLLKFFDRFPEAMKTYGKDIANQ